MKHKEPIKNVDVIKRVNRELFKKKYREYLVVKIALTTGLRVSDILELRKHVLPSTSSPFTIIEKKTKKRKKIELDNKLYHELKEYVKGKRDYEYIFKASKKHNKPICSKTVWNNINECWSGKGRISMHTMRKSYAYHLYKETGDIDIVIEALNHEDVRTTMRYLGISDDVINKANKLVTKKIYG